MRKVREVTGSLLILTALMLLAACAPAAVPQEATAETSAGTEPPAVEATATPEPATATPEPTAVPPTPTTAPTLTEFELLDQGNAALEADDPQNAVGFYNQAIALNGSYGEAFFKRAQAYQALGNFEQAILDYSRAIELGAGNYQAYNSRGELNYATGKIDSALDDFNAAIALEPTFAQAYRNRAELQKGAWLPQAVILDLEVYLALEPEAEDRADVLAMITELEDEIQRIKDAQAGLPFLDDFSDATGGWFGNTPEGSTQIIGGSYYFKDGGLGIEVTTPDNLVWTRPGRSFTDVEIEVDARKVAGANNNVYGVICRYVSYNNFYAFLVTSDGYAGIAKPVDGALDEDVLGESNLVLEAAVNLGQEVNHIRAICKGELLKLYVNDQFVLLVLDESIAYGDVGLIVGSMDPASGTDVLFDNFEVRSAPKDP
ncbi:MAG: tetratricopeptide repeat protein [Anaerolineales bacterium]|nr:tetratricopeptide repeat protein [Anaerolineales bacterium]